MDAVLELFDSLINVFSPDVFALGGQISKASPHFMASLKAACQAVAIPSLYDACKVEIAEQLDDAGLLGASAVARWSL